MKVLIIGTGLAGLMGACTLCGMFSAVNDGEKGLRKGTADAENGGGPRLKEDTAAAAFTVELIGDGGGASPYVHGLNIPLSPKDSVEAFYQDTMESGAFLSRPELTRCLCEESPGITEIFDKLGIELEKKNGEYDLLKPLGSTWPRVAKSGNHTGAKIIHALREYLKNQQNVTFTENSRVLRLDVRNGKVRGAVICHREPSENKEAAKTAQDRSCPAASAIPAESSCETAGILSETNEKKTPDTIEYKTADIILLASGGFCGIYPFSTNMPDSGGDGIAMAYEAGLPLTDLEFVQFEPSVALFPEKLKGKSVITTMFYEGAVLRNGRMERFLAEKGGECVGKDVLTKAIYEEIQSGHPTEHGGVYFDATGVGKEKLLQSYASYAERYDKAGIDISREPFEIGPGAHTSLGGVLINPDGETRVEGLFAAGEIVGGIHGANRIGGNAGLETLVFGKKAGESMRNYLISHKETKEEAPDARARQLLSDARQESGIPMEPEELGRWRKELETILEKNLSITRNGRDLKKACTRLDEMVLAVKKYACPGAPFEKLRLENDLLCAALLAHAADARTESAGCHTRTDGSGKKERCHILLQKGPEGLIIRKEPIKGGNTP